MLFKDLVMKCLEVQSFIESLEYSVEQCEAAQLAGELRVDLEYEYGREYAQSMGWKCPNSKSNFDKGAWTRYWIGLDNLEKNPDAGRPIIPHRSGG